MRSWKTTVAGYVTSGAGLILALSQGGVTMPKWLAITAGFVAAGGIAALGRVSKDYNVTGVGAPPSKDQASK